MLLDEGADVVDRARGLRSTQQEQVLPVAGDPVERGSKPRVVGELGARPTLGHPGPEDLLADIDDLDGAGLVRQMRERGLHRDQPVEQIRLVVLEADVQDVGLPARRDVARHLEGHGRLAGALGTADEHQLAGAQTTTDGLVHRGETERDRLVFADLAPDDLLVEIHQHVERRARRHAAVGRIKTPGRRCGGRLRISGFGAHVGADLPGWCSDAKGSTQLRLNHPPGPLGTAQASAGGRLAKGQ